MWTTEPSGRGVAVAAGGAGGPAWLVGLADPHQPDNDLAALALRNEAVATSSLARRRWQHHHGSPAHHLIDPRTGAPAITDLVSVTVIGPELPASEIHAKVALILGEDRGLAYLAAQPNLSALLVTTAGRQIPYGSFEEKAYVYTNGFTNRFVNLV